MYKESGVGMFKEPEIQFDSAASSIRKIAAKDKVRSVGKFYILVRII